MPVHGDDFRSRPARQPVRRPESHLKKSKNAAENMEAMRSGEHVKKAAGRIGSQEKSGSSELTPGDYLADKKENPENRGDAPPVTETGSIFCKESAPGPNQRKAARD